MSPAAVLAAKKRHQRTLEDLREGSISLAGTSYRAAVILGRIRHQMDVQTGLWRRIQPLTATVLKTRLLTAPEKRAVLVFAGVNYQIDEVGGQNTQDIAWVIRAERKLPSPS